MTNDKGYTLSVPVPLKPFKESPFEQYVRMLKEMGADRVFLFAPMMDSRYMPELSEFREWSVTLRERIIYFKSIGIETAFWMGHTIGHGGALSTGNKSGYQQLTGPNGKEAAGCYCPMDKDFREYVCSTLAIMAESGVELIMIDDDFRVNLHMPEVSTGCFCDLHLDAFRSLTGLNLSRQELVEQALCGKPNKIREKWLKFNGNVMMNFAGEMEAAIHSVNKNTRFGLATAMTLWSSEGVDMRKLLERMAGGTRPFLRTIGAPYWSSEPSNTAWIIEYSRLQKEWLKDWDVELMSEGDTFPHSRFYCSAASLHAFQQGVFASGLTSILNYSLPYVMKPEHEQGYFRKIVESKKNYETICKFFPEDYVNVGINPICTPNNMMNIRLPDKLAEDETSWPDEQEFIKLLSRMGIPIGYGGSEPVFLSGYGAAGLEEEELEGLLSRGAVLDAIAAEWLLERGIDIGIESIEDERPPVFERFFDKPLNGRYSKDNVWILTACSGMFKRFKVKEGAKVLSEFAGIDGMESYPSVIIYENTKKQRFCILTFDILKGRKGRQLLYSYPRQEQLTRCISWVGSKPLTVTVNAHPDVHVICRKSLDGSRTAIAVQNCNLDQIRNPVLRLSPEVKPGELIELLLPDGDESFETDEFQYENDGEYGYLKIKAVIPSMGMLGIGLKKDSKG